MRNIVFIRSQSLLRQLIRGAELLIALSLFTAFAACQDTPKKEQTSKNKTPSGQQQITDGFYRLLSNEAVKMNVALAEIRPLAKPQNIAKAQIEKYVGTRRRFVNAELNSRVPISLKTGEWKLKWQTDLAPSFTPSAILEANDRIIVESDGVWFLFDRDGKKLLNGQLGASGIILDDENFYAADSTGLIDARRLSDGADVFGLSLFFGDAYKRTFMLRKDQKFLAVSTERELDPHKSDKLENSLVELVDLGEPVKTDRDGLLKSAKTLGHLARKTDLLITAVNGETIVLTTKNRIYRLDMNLNAKDAFSAEFTPLAMSLDEAGRIYMAVREKDRVSLWTLLPTGELVMTLHLPASFERIVQPPIVGYDHTVYVIAGDGILAVDQAGKLAWQNTTVKRIGGAVISADDLLLVSAGSEVMAFDAGGRKQTVWTTSDEDLRSAPVLTVRGEILVASRKRLYCLIPK